MNKLRFDLSAPWNTSESALVSLPLHAFSILGEEHLTTGSGLCDQFCPFFFNIQYSILGIVNHTLSQFSWLGTNQVSTCPLVPRALGPAPLAGAPASNTRLVRWSQAQLMLHFCYFPYKEGQEVRPVQS